MSICNIFLPKSGPQKHTMHSENHISTWTQLYRLDNRSYYTIQPLAYLTYDMKIGLWPVSLEFSDNLSQKLIRTAHQNSHQFLKKLNGDHWIGSSSPETNPSGILTNIDLT